LRSPDKLISYAAPSTDAAGPHAEHIFVGNMVGKDLQVFSLDGGTLKDTGVRIAVKGGPAAIRIAGR
jgi:hypothetical protein